MKTNQIIVFLKTKEMEKEIGPTVALPDFNKCFFS